MNRQQTAAKNYLMRAYRVDQRIENKLEQIQLLNDLAAKATVTYSDMPGSPNRNVHKMEDVLVKIIDIKTEINADMLELVDLKKETMDCIKQVDDPELQLILELRYLNYVGWEQIAGDLGYGIDNVFRLHRKALDFIEVPETLQ
ncbi:MAG: DUF1492 domain-containing protein [Lachnospiraceae bacterium]|jgi:DNA-directed RNA polymerase specialized sigma subunit|nr:DUF1492 domain-containing protein [uncultured Acetatifactor sp.]MCI9189474.1 DUF1492 domain-containing protein [Lachnospiraceae bacterium]